MRPIILHEYLKRQNVKRLKQINKILRYPICKKRKEELIKQVIFHFIIKTLQRKWRSKYINDVDPVTSEKIRYPCWNKNVSTTRIYYNLDTIIKHIITNGPNSTDPMTRIKYTDKEIRELDKLYKFYKLYDKYNVKSIVTVFNNVEYYKTLLYNNERIDVIRDEIFTLLSRSMDYITDYLQQQAEPEPFFYDNSDDIVQFDTLRIIDREEIVDDEQTVIVYEDLSDDENDGSDLFTCLGQAMLTFQNTYWLFMSLRSLSEHWFEATFKYVISRVEEDKEDDPQGIKKDFIIFIRKLRLICINNS